jgi:hypothetical protein
MAMIAPFLQDASVESEPRKLPIEEATGRAKIDGGGRCASFDRRCRAFQT